MGIFDKIFGKKNNSGVSKLIKEHFNLDKDDVLIANQEDMEDIGIVTHYKGKPFTGIAFWQNSDGEIDFILEMKDGLKHGKSVDLGFGETKIQFYKNDLQEGKHTYESIKDERFPSFKKFEYNLYYEQGKCINYDENYIKNCVNILFRAHCFNELNAINKIRGNPSNQIPYEQFVSELRESNKKVLEKAISELKEGFQLKIKNNSEEIEFCKTIDSILESRKLSISEKNRSEFLKTIFLELLSKEQISNSEDPIISIMNYLKDFKEDNSNNTNDNPLGITNDELNKVGDKIDNMMNNLEEKRKNSKNIKSDIFKILEKKEISNIWVNFLWVEPNREFDEVEEWVIDDFYLFSYNTPKYESGEFKRYKDGETYKVSENNLEKWQIMTFEKENKIIEILSKFMHPYNYTNQDANCLLKFDNGILTYTIEEDWINGFFNSETGNWDEVDEDSAFKITWEITDKGIFEIEE